MALVTASCAPPQLAEYVPETAGVVTRRTLVGKDLKFELTGGRVFTSPANMDYLGGGQPQVGDLLLAGRSPDLWVSRAMPEGQPGPGGPICYRLYGKTRTTEAQVFKTIPEGEGGEFVVVFPKALGWKELGASGDEPWGLLTCINEDGEAFGQRPANAEN